MIDSCKLYRYVLLLFFSLFVIQGKAQNAQKILERAICQWDIEKYEMGLEYRLYKGETGKKVYESYSGLVSKNENSVYQKIGPMESLRTDSLFVKLNHVDKEMLVMKNRSEFSFEVPTVNLERVTDYYEVETLADHTKYYELLLVPKPQNTLGISKIIVHIGKETGFVKKQVLFYSTMADFSIYNTESTRPDYGIIRLEIHFTNFRKKIQEGYFKEGRYFTRGEQTFTPGEEFKNFEIISTN